MKILESEFRKMKKTVTFQTPISKIEAPVNQKVDKVNIILQEEPLLVKRERPVHLQQDLKNVVIEIEKDCSIIESEFPFINMYDWFADINTVRFTAQLDP